MSVFEILSLLADGMVVSLEIFALTLVFALPLGMLICAGRMSKIKPIAGLFRIYISVMRGTPLMLQLFVVYYLPYYVLGIKLSVFGTGYKLFAVIAAFVLNYAAYFAEIYRSGIASMPQGQYEAAKVLGMSRSQTFFVVILPQVVRRVLPALTNEVITLVKDTSLAFAIGQIEMFTKAKMIAADETSMAPYAVAGVLYYIFNFVVATAMEKLEARFGKYSIK